jgi:hypothetical protein
VAVVETLLGGRPADIPQVDTHASNTEPLPAFHGYGANSDPTGPLRRLTDPYLEEVDAWGYQCLQRGQKAVVDSVTIMQGLSVSETVLLNLTNREKVGGTFDVGVAAAAAMLATDPGMVRRMREEAAAAAAAAAVEPSVTDTPSQALGTLVAVIVESAHGRTHTPPLCATDSKNTNNNNNNEKDMNNHIALAQAIGNIFRENVTMVSYIEEILRCAIAAAEEVRVV